MTNLTFSYLDLIFLSGEIWPISFILLLCAKNEQDDIMSNLKAVLKKQNPRAKETNRQMEK